MKYHIFNLKIFKTKNDEFNKTNIITMNTISIIWIKINITVQRSFSFKSNIKKKRMYKKVPSAIDILYCIKRR